jgi:hypothetical protein
VAVNSASWIRTRDKRLEISWLGARKSVKDSEIAVVFQMMDRAGEFNTMKKIVVFVVAPRFGLWFCRKASQQHGSAP